MRIAYASAHYAPFVGGVEKHIVEIAARMAARGHEVTVLTHDEPDGGLPSAERVDGVSVRRFPVPLPSRNYALSPGLWAHLIRFGDRYDVVHAHGYHALPPLAASLGKRSPLVFTPHYHGTGHSPFRKALHPPYRVTAGRYLVQRADQVIAVSQPEAGLFLRHFPFAAGKLTVIPNGVDVEGLRAVEPYAMDQTVVLSAGRIEDYKQVDKTVEAMRHLPPEFVLRVTGDGPARAGLEQLARDAGLGDRVQFLGRVSDEELQRWTRTAAVYVSMSSNEAMPITVIELLAAGAGVVASDIPAHVDMREKTSGDMTLVPLDSSPERVAAAIRESAARDPHPARIATWDDVTDRTVAVYEELGERSPALAEERRTAPSA